jgi:hypothetical protein
MVELHYFAEGGARVPVEEIILELKDNEAVVFKEFFSAGLRIPRHPVLTDFFLKFQVQQHQLTPMR